MFLFTWPFIALHVLIESWKSKHRISIYQLAPKTPWFAKKTTRIRTDHHFVIFALSAFHYISFFLELRLNRHHVRLVWMCQSAVRRHSSKNNISFDCVLRFWLTLTFYWSQINPFGSFGPNAVAMFGFVVSAFSHFFDDLLRTLFQYFLSLKK